MELCNFCRLHIFIFNVNLSSPIEKIIKGVKPKGDIAMEDKVDVSNAGILQKGHEIRPNGPENEVRSVPSHKSSQRHIGISEFRMPLE